MATDQVIQFLQERFADIAFAPAPLVDTPKGRTDQICVRIPPDRLVEVMTFLRDDPRTRFEQLCDLTCVDYLTFPKAQDRYGVTYSLLSLTHNHRLWAKCFVNDPDPQVPTVTGVWLGADWMEREVYDMYGVRLCRAPRPAAHPDLGCFRSYPLRKDYPRTGLGRARGLRDAHTREQLTYERVNV